MNQTRKIEIAKFYNQDCNLMLGEPMKSFSLILLLPLFSLAQSTFAMTCVASLIDVKSQNVVSEYQNLITESESSTHLTLSTEIRDRSFFALYFRDTKDVLLQIIHRDDETKGLTSKARFDADGRMAVSEVNGPVTYRLECAHGN